MMKKNHDIKTNIKVVVLRKPVLSLWVFFFTGSAAIASIKMAPLKCECLMWSNTHPGYWIYIFFLNRAWIIHTSVEWKGRGGGARRRKGNWLCGQSHKPTVLTRCGRDGSGVWLHIIRRLLRRIGEQKGMSWLQWYYVLRSVIQSVNHQSKSLLGYFGTLRCALVGRVSAMGNFLTRCWAATLRFSCCSVLECKLFKPFDRAGWSSTMAMITEHYGVY